MGKKSVTFILYKRLIALMFRELLPGENERKVGKGCRDRLSGLGLP